MRRAFAVVLVSSMLVVPSVAQAEEPGYKVPPSATDPSGVGDADASGAPTSLGGEGDSARAPKRRPTKTIRRCATRKGKRTCRNYRGSRIVKTCTKRKGKRERCSKAKSSAAVKVSSGYEQSVGPAIGRSYYSGSENTVPGNGWCSGSFIGYGLFLTAAHCLYQNGETANGQRYGFESSRFGVVPGNTVNSQGQSASDYGTWRVTENYVPTGYTQGDSGLDWGIQVIAPDSRGNYPGQYTGTYTAYPGTTIYEGNVLYSSGYPASGLFRTPQYFYGAGQYFCNDTWDGNGWWDYGQNLGLQSGTWLYYTCEMTGGSSGGPVFTRFSDGSYGIIGVVNRGLDTREQTSQYLGIYQLSVMLDDRFTQFYQSVVNVLSGRSAARTASKSPSAPLAVGEQRR